MTELLETLGVVVLAAAGGFAGWAFSRLKSRAWMVGYLAPLSVVVMIALARRVPRLAMIAPFRWLMAGRTEFVLYGTMGTMLLLAPLSRLKRKILKHVAVAFLLVAVPYVSVLPFLAPLLIRGRLSRLPTVVGEEGVCLQTTWFTCGPAAAATALRRLGFEAEEGELAILSHTSPVAGTPPDLLCDALQRRYGSQGLACEYRFFESVDELRGAGLVLAETRLSFFFDHWVAVLGVSDDAVALGDPLHGRRALTREQFRRIWRFTGIVLTRERGNR